ncbi:hypothetical protein GALL_193490 [mine drainage metagenome]|uniref:Uncharacterized protein n=1 Tax=mine drainage metagenome TaxID=410659 RepID=A0A1J5SAB6_9ZZZZ
MKNKLNNSLLMLFVLLSNLLLFAGGGYSEELGVTDLSKYPNLLENFKECKLNLQYDINHSSIVNSMGYQVHVDKNGVELKDDYAFIKIKGQLLGFKISVLRIPTSKGPNVWEQYTVTLHGRVSEVLTTLEKTWHVKFEFRGPDDGTDEGDGPQITYAANVNHEASNVISRLFLESYSDQDKQSFLQCDFLNNKGD